MRYNVRRVVTDLRSIAGSRRPQWRLRIDFPSETYLPYVVGDAKATSSRRRRGGEGKIAVNKVGLCT